MQILKDKGLTRKGKLVFGEKNKTEKTVMVLELGIAEEKELEQIILQIEEMLLSDTVPQAVEKSGCKKCSYYEYCFI